MAVQGGEIVTAQQYPEEVGWSWRMTMGYKRLGMVAQSLKPPYPKLLL